MENTVENDGLVYLKLNNEFLIHDSKKNCLYLVKPESDLFQILTDKWNEQIENEKFKTMCAIDEMFAIALSRKS